MGCEKDGPLDEIDEAGNTNDFGRGISKINGLFQRVLGKLRIGATDLAYLGGSNERDVIPARKCGIFTIQYSEGKPNSLDPNALKIGNLGHLETILGSSPSLEAGAAVGSPIP